MVDATEIRQLFNNFSKEVLTKFSKLTNVNTRLSNFVEDRQALDTTVELICEKEMFTTRLEISM